MAAKPFGRFALCGMISQYNNTDLGEGVRGLVMAVGKSLKLQGFIVSNHQDMQGAFLKDLSAWVAAGKINGRDTVKEGIENAPAAFLGLFKGENLGKMLVRLS
jgi:NADPH-dependent curcumin reductase CurA